ncbi:hypothetical protein N185_35275 [Sinorhizobium sp. GW3]|nr:hypothetical protein N185_35275 [Sinorhizobium sp. GW3]
MDVEFRIEAAERQLVMIHSFFPRIDAKITTLFAMTSAQIAIAALNVTLSDLKHWYVTVPGILFCAAACAVMINLYYCTYPHLRGVQGSLVFFVEIGKRSASDYLQAYTHVSGEALLEDLTHQIWRNSQIVQAKFHYLKNAMVITMLSVLPWAILLLGTSINNARLPQIGN